jgi:hypothetical protein
MYRDVIFGCVFMPRPGRMVAAECRCQQTMQRCIWGLNLRVPTPAPEILHASVVLGFHVLFLGSCSVVDNGG